MLLRAYVRDRSALFFTFFLPFLFMIIFGFLNFGSLGRVDVGIVDEAGNPDSERFVQSLAQIPSLRIERVARDAMARKLQRSELDLAIVIPADFRIRPLAAPAAIQLYENQATTQEVAVGRAIIGDVIDRISFAAAGSAPVITVSRQEVSGVRLRYVDFLVPGILGLNVMQLNIFSIAFALVAQKQRGVLRRIFATPLDPRRFVAAHGLMRLILSMVQVGILLVVAFLLFQVQVVGNIFALFAVALIGAVPFLMQGFALAGWAETENQVPPVANLLTLPQFFLSGVFFSKEAAPALIRPISDLLPLTLLNDALREISTQGATLWDVRSQLLGLVVWAVVSFAVAVRLLRFETP
ncbi:MAG: ABC transporter permease [Chloroflexi bacterium]|nr:ABC transporter permease [Chloroflexota bacterium]